MRTIIIITPDLSAWGNFKKLCKAKGWVYQTLANQKKIPTIGNPVEIDGVKVHRIGIN